MRAAALATLVATAADLRFTVRAAVAALLAVPQSGGESGHRPDERGRDPSGHQIHQIRDVRERLSHRNHPSRPSRGHSRVIKQPRSQEVRREPDPRIPLGMQLSNGLP